MIRSFEIRHERDIADAPLRVFETLRDLLSQTSQDVISFGLNPQYTQKYIRERFAQLGLTVDDFVELTSTNFSTLQPHSSIPTGIESISLGVFRPNGDCRMHVQNLPDEERLPTIDVVSRGLLVFPTSTQLVDLPGDYDLQEVSGLSRDIYIGVPVGCATAFCRLQQDSSFIVCGKPQMVLEVLKVSSDTAEFGKTVAATSPVKSGVFARRYLKKPE